ncbi:MAG: HEAT repeat domain-containing protein [Planctomycetota bacterium]|jgi:HEAT repeat protein
MALVLGRSKAGATFTSRSFIGPLPVGTIRRPIAALMRPLLVLLLVAAVASANDLNDAIKLLKSRNPNDKIRGAQKARALGGRAKKATKYLVRDINHPDWQVRSAVQKALVSIGSVAVPALLKGIAGKDVAARGRCAETIRLIGGRAREHADAIGRELANESPKVRKELALTLVLLGEAALPALDKALGGRSRDQRAAAATAFAQLGSKSIRPLRGALKAKSAYKRSGAAVALGLMGPKAAEAAGDLRGLLADASAEVRADAARAMGRIKAGEEAAVPALIKAFGDPDAFVRSAAVEGAAALGMAAAEALVAALATDVRDEARKALLAMREHATEALSGGLTSDNPTVREASVRALGEMDPLVKVYASELEALLKDKQPSVRAAAAGALARRGAADAVETLSAAARDPDASVRAAAVRALGFAGASEKVLAALKTASADATPGVKLAAAASLWNLGQESDVIAQARAALATQDPALRDAAALAIARMGRAAEPLGPDLVAASESGASPAVVDALGTLAVAHGGGVIGRADRYRKASGKVKHAIDYALDWLERFQDREGENAGRWHPAEFVNHAPGMTGQGVKHYGAGVTGLSLSAFLAVGRADDPAVKRGLDYLARIQRPDGLFAAPISMHFMIDHAFATTALCEAWLITNDPRYRDTAQRAVNVIVAARNPFLGWRYEPRGGENDTNVTVAALTALFLANAGGLDVPIEAFLGGGAWLLSMTETAGAIGYNMRGGSCARPEGLQERFPPDESESMTAAGLWGLHLVARFGVEAPDLRECEKSCLKLLPLWSGGRTDMYFWHYGSLYLHAAESKGDKRWKAALIKALGPAQRDQPATFIGSWDPAGPWGKDGGRVYSTALNALSLATPYRFAQDVATAKPKGAAGAALKALRALAKSDDAAIRERAAHWLRRAGG